MSVPNISPEQNNVTQLMLEIRDSLNRTLSPLKLADAEFSLSEDISHIQNVHSVIVQDLEELNKTIERYIDIVDKTELITNTLNCKEYELKYAFRTEFDQLKDKKDVLIAKSTELEFEDQGKMALQIVEIDDLIEYLTEDHQKELDSIKEQKLDAQKQYENAVAIMEDQYEKMYKGFRKLLFVIEAEAKAVNASQADLIKEKNASIIEFYKDQLDKYSELQTTGWKVIYPEEKISATLQERGLKVSHSGLILTDTGKSMSLEEAKKNKLLDGMEPEDIETIRKSIVDLNMQKLKEEKHRKSGDDWSSKSDGTASRKMSSEDVCYLKTFLGKPLTLALAEITAVQPRDPIHYLGHWLFKFRYNQQMEDINNMEFEALNELRIKSAQERWHKFVEDEARACVIDMIVAAEAKAMINELKRIQNEAQAMEEEENLEDEARDVLGTYNGPTSGQVSL